MDLLLVAAAVIISWLVFTWFVRVAKTTAKTAFLIAALVLLLQITVGIGPEQIFQKILEFPDFIKSLFQNGSNPPNL
ncbi:hypothetical protein GS597_10720 [Synechococcales cyanobacterium C]|uniref:Uncharacterized protein n=1 Tax=Petrachloros mirabilis ULC683 TaxID=2781853 RepID=A0A8K1ZZH0_9CYAN|nr:hypothetical protein [Petrachloros mirabilis]NCJ06972.1 hypothetical protein [Petrachloros mirabilis ULC683]